MDADRFRTMVARLETESQTSPLAYRVRVAGLAALGFGLLALLFATLGAGLLVLVAAAAAVAFSGGAALLLLLKFAKVLVFLAWPLWAMVRNGVQALFVRLPPPQGREITRDEAPALFAALDDLRARLRGPRFHRVLIVDELNAAVVQRPAFGLVGWPRNHLLLGLPLLDAMDPAEAMAVVAHEYGHLAGSHGRFAAFIYRLRWTWATVQDQAQAFPGWLGRGVARLVRWYAPYFNAYTFVLARANEYQADAAAAQLVGAHHAAHALKRVNIAGPRHARFMTHTFDRIARDPAPPADLMHRWAAEARAPLPGEDAERWLGMALDREGDLTDTHPTLRARLAALGLPDDPAQAPPPLQGPTAAQVWLGPSADVLRAEFQARWATQVADAWQERHAQAQQQRQRLAVLRALPARDRDETLEMLHLGLRLEPDTDARPALAAFNAAHPDDAPGLFLEGRVHLDAGDAAGIALLERACALDPDAIKPACERAHAFLLARRDTAAAEAWAQRWRERDAFEALREAQLRHFGPDDRLVTHGLDAAQWAAMRDRLGPAARASVAEVYVARRVIPVDPDARQWVVAVRLTAWGRWRGKQEEVLRRLAAIEWSVPVVVVTLQGAHASWRKRLRALDGARLA